jgi:hypothetical protein
MRKGIIVTVSAADRARMEAVAANRNSPQKRVWRCRIVLLIIEYCGGRNRHLLPDHLVRQRRKLLAHGHNFVTGENGAAGEAAAVLDCDSVF